MLRADEEARATLTRCPASQAVGVAANLLIHIRSQQVVVKTNHNLPIAEKVCRLGVTNRKAVVVEIQKLLIESLNSVEVHLDSVAIEGRQELFGDNILMQNDGAVAQAEDPLMRMRVSTWQLGVGFYF